MLSSVVDDSDDIDHITERLVKKINGCIKTNFTKRRIKTHIKNDDDFNIYDKMRDLKNKDDETSKKEMDKVVEAIAEKAEENFIKIKDGLKSIKPDDGAVNSKDLWKLKKKLCPKCQDPYSAMLDSSGNLLTSDEAIKQRAHEVYYKRLEANKIESHLKELENDTNTLCEVRLKINSQE